MRAAGTNIILFKEKRFIGVILYVFSFQMLLALLTDKDILLIKQKISIAAPVIIDFSEYLVVGQIMKVWELVPVVLATFAFLAVLVGAMIILMLAGGYILSLLLKLWN